MTRPTARLLLDTLRFRRSAPPEVLAAEWSEADGRGLDRLVDFEACASWLYRRLRQLGAVDLLDPGFREWLAEVTWEETARNMMVDAEARAVAELLPEIGVPGVFIKGVARRVSMGRYPQADARMTQDVDVLVPAERAFEVWFELRRRGYRRTKPNPPPRPEHHHLTALMSERLVAVEVHTTVDPRLPAGEAWRRFYESGEDVVRDGVAYRVPPPTELFWSATAHGLLHPDIAFVMIQFLSAAVIWASGAAIDWVEIRRRLETKEILDRVAARAWLSAVAQIVGVTPPSELAGMLEPYDLGRALELRLAVLRHVHLPRHLWKSLAWWSSERAQSVREGLVPA